MRTGDPDCPFCEIVARDDPDAREVYRDEHVVAFFPVQPATLGHTLVVPRKHIPDIWSLDPGTAGHLAQVVLFLAGAVRRSMSPEGLNIIQSNGEAASQTVMHLHVHIVPRWSSDTLGRIWPPETHYSEREKDVAWERLKEEVRVGRRGKGTRDQSQRQEHADPEDRRKHLDFIQAVVTRMSASSATTKGWLLPVVTAAYGFAVTSSAPAVALLGMAAVVLFAVVDANYLNQERSFRRLYDAVARQEDVPPFSMDPSLAAPAVQQTLESLSWWERGWAGVRDWIPSWAVWSSWAIAPFYGSLLLVGLVIFLSTR